MDKKVIEKRVTRKMHKIANNMRNLCKKYGIHYMDLCVIDESITNDGDCYMFNNDYFKDDVELCIRATKRFEDKK